MVTNRRVKSLPLLIVRKSYNQKTKFEQKTVQKPNIRTACLLHLNLTPFQNKKQLIFVTNLRLFRCAILGTSHSLGFSRCVLHTMILRTRHVLWLLLQHTRHSCNSIGRGQQKHAQKKTIYIICKLQGQNHYEQFTKARSFSLSCAPSRWPLRRLLPRTPFAPYK
jgi:hypothetical protein